MDDRVVISTVHRAKGLEWESVYVPFFNEVSAVPGTRRLAAVVVVRLGHTGKERVTEPPHTRSACAHARARAGLWVCLRFCGQTRALP